VIKISECSPVKSKKAEGQKAQISSSKLQNRLYSKKKIQKPSEFY